MIVFICSFSFHAEIQLASFSRFLYCFLFSIHVAELFLNHNQSQVSFYSKSSDFRFPQREDRHPTSSVYPMYALPELSSSLSIFKSTLSILLFAIYNFVLPLMSDKVHKLKYNTISYRYTL